MTLKIIESIAAKYIVEYPDVSSEFEVQAYLYSELRRSGLDVRGEVKARGCFGLRPSKTGCRFDLVLFKDRVATIILEVKGGLVRHGEGGIEATRQGFRYPHFGLPVWIVYGMPGAEEVIKRLVL